MLIILFIAVFTYYSWPTFNNYFVQWTSIDQDDYDFINKLLLSASAICNVVHFRGIMAEGRQLVNKDIYRMFITYSFYGALGSFCYVAYKIISVSGIVLFTIIMGTIKYWKRVSNVKQQ